MSADAMSFYLTQRLTRRPGSAKGFDGLFACQYMGSAEFEWGALPESLKNIRAARKIGVHVGLVTRTDTTVPVFVVGDIKRIDRVPDELTRWMADDYPRGKEMTYFPEHVTNTVKDYQRQTHAWWSLSDDVLWALHADTADLLLKAVAT